MCSPQIFAPVQFYSWDVLGLSASKSSSHKGSPPEAKLIPTETAHGLGSREQQQQQRHIFYTEKDFSIEIKSYCDLLDSNWLDKLLHSAPSQLLKLLFLMWMDWQALHSTLEKLYRKYYLHKKSEGGTSEGQSFIFSFLKSCSFILPLIWMCLCS